MKPFFAIAPWEYVGADFDAAPHAIVRSSVKGQGKTWWLKIREGIIYFRDAAKVKVFAIPQRFDDLNPDDSEQLTQTWQREIERENYGVHLLSRRIWPGTRATSSFCIIVRADGSGTIREHFDTNWREFQLDLPKPLNLWAVQASDKEVEQIIKTTSAKFLARAVDTSHFINILEQWRRGCIAGPANEARDEMVRVMMSAVQLWAPEDFYTQPQTLNCQSNSDFFAGGVGSGFGFDSHLRLRQIWELARWHFGYVGIEWQRASDNAELQAQYGPHIWKRNFDKYGENWRGNWVSHQYQSQFELPAISRASAHDKLEAALVLREFLRGKASAEKVEAWLQAALA